MMTRYLSLFACLTLGWSFAATADDVKVEGDLKKMQGEWVSMDDQGESTWTFSCAPPWNMR